MILSFVIYHCALFISVSSAYISERLKDYKFLFVMLSFSCVVVLCGLRNYVGTDYESYVSIYETISSFGFAPIEPGFSFLNKSFSTVQNGYQEVFFICSFLTFFLLYHTLYRERILAAGIFFAFTFSFIFLANNIIRQALVIPVFFYSVYYIERHKLVKYILTVLFCSLFHFSAILLIPFYWIGRISFSKVTWACLMSVCFLLSYTQIIKALFVRIVSQIPRYAGYINTGEEDVKAIKSGTTMVLLFVLALVVICYKQYLEKKRDKIYFNLFLAGVAISFLTMNISFLFRFSYYLSTLIIIVIPLLLKNMNYTYEKYLLAIFFVGYSMIWWFKALWLNDHGCMPYTFS